MKNVWIALAGVVLTAVSSFGGYVLSVHLNYNELRADIKIIRETMVTRKEFNELKILVHSNTEQSSSIVQKWGPKYR